MTYTKRLRYLHQLELQKDAEQESDSVLASQEEFANTCKRTIEVCLDHVKCAIIMVSKNIDVDRQMKILKAQRRPISDNISRLEKIGRGDLISDEARCFIRNIVNL
tara:strand:+ start:635 stop:952 length:318 start_codon:yes stop_codon:yes gene_type:complete